VFCPVIDPELNPWASRLSARDALDCETGVPGTGPPVSSPPQLSEGTVDRQH